MPHVIAFYIGIRIGLVGNKRQMIFCKIFFYFRLGSLQKRAYDPAVLRLYPRGAFQRRTAEQIEKILSAFPLLSNS